MCAKHVKCNNNIENNIKYNINKYNKGAYN